MATEWISPTWRMPENSNQSKVDNYSLEFDGTGDKVQTTLTPPLADNPRSISIWFYTSVSSGIQNICGYGAPSQVSGHNGFDILIYTGGYVGVHLFGTAIIAGGTYNANAWNHYVITYDGTTLQGYLNGVTVDSDNTEVVNTLSTNDFIIGQGVYTGFLEFSGKLSAVSVFDYALTFTQVKYLFNNNAGGTTPNPQNPMAISGNAPIAYYPLGGSSTGSSSTLTTPNESVPSATVFDFVSADGDRILCSPTTVAGTGPINGINGAITISIWLNSTQASVNAYPINRDFSGSSDWRFRQRSDTNLFQLYLTNTSSAVLDVELTGSTDPEGNPYIVVNDGKWHHIVGVYNGTDTAELYTDGVLQGSATSAGFGTLNTGSRTVIGGVNNSAGNPYAGSGAWNGDLSNAQIWDTNLSSSEITTLYNNGVPYTGTQPQAANLKGWWKMNVDTSNWNGSNWVIGDARTSYNKCLNFPTQTDNFKYDSFNFNGKSEISFSFWYNHHVTVNSNDKILGTKDTIYWAFAANQNRSGLGGSVSLTIKTGDNASSNTAAVTIPNVTDANSGWNLLTGTYDGSNFRGYLNGVQVGSDQAITGNLMSSTGAGSRDLNVAVRDGAGAVMAGMKISNFVMWDKGLTSPEVATLFNGGIPFAQKSDFPQQGNMSLWNTLTDMNTSSGGGVFDNSGNGVVITSPSNPPVSFDLLVSALNGISSGMTTANLVNSDLTRSIPYSSYSMVFDGTDDYVSISYSGDIYACSIWFKPNTTITTSSALEYLISFGAEFDGILLGAATSSLTNELIVIGNDNAGIGRSAYTKSGGTISNTWHHLCFNWSGSVYEIWLDGVNVQNASNGTPALINSSQIKIGKNSSGTVRDFNGNISNAAVFSSVLTQDQILTIYNAGVPNSISSLSPAGWWSLGSDSYYASDWICPDLSSGSNNGTGANLAATALVGDGPGSTANGIATSMDIPANLKGNAPNSSKNAFSVNMNSADRVEDVAPTP